MSHTESAAQPGRLVEMTWVTAAGTKGAETVLTETSMILNREWVGNEIYLLVLGYLVVGVGLVAGESIFGEVPSSAGEAETSIGEGANR